MATLGHFFAEGLSMHCPSFHAHCPLHQALPRYLSPSRGHAAQDRA
eukprot:CAMPEP_0175603644 /NCGR_PEP_ID=MMETSP0096-20121207/59257_1 /TAXON_ID=311494 /ORGANISM="Alexandrium monilatum, Strain CCMP3105" /LENGTH=45 /DNA_ID= /DNA_START= /DNA_END= /DNA_ORIENTATION=